jgi:hypothetical protein
MSHTGVRLGSSGFVVEGEHWVSLAKLFLRARPKPDLALAAGTGPLWRQIRHLRHLELSE